MQARLGTGLSGGERGGTQGLKGILESAMENTGQSKKMEGLPDDLTCCTCTGPGTWEGDADTWGTYCGPSWPRTLIYCQHLSV